VPGFLPLHLHAEWAAITHGRRNVLLAGAPSALDAMLASMLPHFREPIRVFASDTNGALQLSAEGTLILMEIADLKVSHQSEVAGWLEQFTQREPVQIVSTTTRSMMPLVESGAFRADLYYRLNVIRIDLAEVATEDIG
jgi:transcriptional regulator of acetoin/glycerol metabolism